MLGPKSDFKYFDKFNLVSKVILFAPVILKAKQKLYVA